MMMQAARPLKRFVCDSCLREACVSMNLHRSPRIPSGPVFSPVPVAVICNVDYWQFRWRTCQWHEIWGDQAAKSLFMGAR
jgi:hypothetical protein